MQRSNGLSSDDLHRISIPSATRFKSRQEFSGTRKDLGLLVNAWSEETALRCRRDTPFILHELSLNHHLGSRKLSQNRS